MQSMKKQEIVSSFKEQTKLKQKSEKNRKILFPFIISVDSYLYALVYLPAERVGSVLLLDF